MSLDDFIRSLFHPIPPDHGPGAPPGSTDGPRHGRPHLPHDEPTRPLSSGAFDQMITESIESIFHSFMGSGITAPSKDHAGPPSSYGGPADGWSFGGESGPQIEIWSWHDTRDDFGDEGSHYDHSGCDCEDGTPRGADEGFVIEDHNDGWTSESPIDGGDVFRGFFSGFDSGINDIFKRFRFSDDDGEQEEGASFFSGRHFNDTHGGGIGGSGRKSLRDYMLKGPIIREPITSPPDPNSDTCPPPTINPPTAPPCHDSALNPSQKQDSTLDFKNDIEKSDEIARILAAQDHDRQPDQETSAPGFQSPPRLFGGTWGSILPRHFFGGGKGADDDGWTWGGSAGPHHDPNGLSSSWSSSFSYKSTSTSTTVKQDGTTETKKVEKDGRGNVVETLTRKRGGRRGTVITKRDSEGNEVIQREGDESLF